MPQSFTNLIYHPVFATKNRRPLITDEVKPGLYDDAGGIIRHQGGVAIAINGMADHLHILAKLRADSAISDVLRELRAHSSGWMHEIFPEVKDFSWQKGYGPFTVSTSQVEKVKRYIADQETHHQKIGSFRDKFMKLLRSHEIEFDEKYLFI